MDAIESLRALTRGVTQPNHSVNLSDHSRPNQGHRKVVYDASGKFSWKASTGTSDSED